jgi:hypothetical protein
VREVLFDARAQPLDLVAIELRAQTHRAIALEGVDVGLRQVHACLLPIDGAADDMVSLSDRTWRKVKSTAVPEGSSCDEHHGLRRAP